MQGPVGKGESQRRAPPKYALGEGTRPPSGMIVSCVNLVAWVRLSSELTRRLSILLPRQARSNPTQNHVWFGLCGTLLAYEVSLLRSRSQI